MIFKFFNRVIFFALGFSFFNMAFSLEKDISKSDSYLSLQEAIIDIFEQNESSVVRVFASAKNQTGSQISVGTGFLISKDGHILTNSVVLKNADKIWVDLKSIPYQAILVGEDPLTSLALLKIETSKSFDNFISFSQNGNFPKVGTILLGITCQLGDQPSPSFGILTSHSVSFGKKVFPSVYLKSSLSLDGGEIGSPVFDLKGKFLGMLIASMGELKGSFILPAKAIARVRDDLLLNGAVSYAWFGLQTQEISDSVNGTRVIVDKIVKSSPADEAGFKPLDVILSINSSQIISDKDLKEITFYVRPSETVSFKVLRKGKKIDIKLKTKSFADDVLLKLRSVKVNFTENKLK